jgi:nucleotide-binding universal stress UspA family protein
MLAPAVTSAEGQAAMIPDQRVPAGPPAAPPVVVDGPSVPGWVREWCRVTGRALTAGTAGRDAVHLRRPAPLRQAPTVVAALRDLPGDAAVLDEAAETARVLGGVLVLAHGVPLSFGERSVGLDEALSHGEQVLEDARTQLARAAPGLPVEARLRRVWPHELVGEGSDADLLVVGGPHRGSHGRLGPVASSAVSHAPCPVLLVPREG